MSKGLRTVAEVAKAVAILRTRDAARARELKRLRGDIDALERRLAPPVLPFDAFMISPAAIPRPGSTVLPDVPGFAGTALQLLARFSLRRLMQRIVRPFKRGETATDGNASCGPLP